MKIVIPARYASTRFPGKPLAQIAGKSLLHRVWERCVSAASPADVIVATDDDRIERHCRDYDMQVARTSAECMTGSDRVWEVMQRYDLETVVNVQGDEPLIDPESIRLVMRSAEEHPQAVINAMAPIASLDEFHSGSVPKVCAAPDGRLLYMSRAGVPLSKTQSMVKANKQVCIYAFPRQALELFAAQSAKTPLERVEDIEILRFLELGLPVRMVSVPGASIAVDVPEDVERVERVLDAMA